MSAAPSAVATDKQGGDPEPPKKPMIELPYLLDFIPLQDSKSTAISRHYDALKEGRLETTKCSGCGALHYPPKITCPACMGTDVDWVELPRSGTVYAHTAVVLGAPLTMEEEAPFVLGLVDLDAPDGGGENVRLLSRFEGGDYDAFAIGSRVQMRVHHHDDGRVSYRFAPSS